MLFSTAVTLITVLLSYLDPAKVFLYLMALATISIIINWSIILIVQLKFRKQKEQVNQPLLFKMPLYPISSYISLVFLAAIVVIMAFMPDMRYSLYVAPVWLLCLYVGYKLKTTKSND